jgi:apolipoprotein N-acyltransferase
LGLAAVGAVLFWAALPPLSFGLLGWTAPVAWILLVRSRQLAGRRPYRTLWLVGFLFWLAAIHWLRLPHPATNLGWIALSFYLGFYLPVFVGLSRIAVHRWHVPLVAATPVVWTGLELARAHLLSGFSMGALGHTQYRWIELIQISDLAGGYAVDFLLVFVAACVARMIPLEGQRWTFWPVVPAVLLLAATLGYGYARIAQGEKNRAADGPLTRVALIQGSIDSVLGQDTREEHLRQYSRLTREALDRYGRVDLIVWPEGTFRDSWVSFTPDATAPEDWPESEAKFRARLEEVAASRREVLSYLARQLDAALLLGVNTEHYEAQGVKLYNSALFVTRQGEVGERYDKVHCVVFGEYMPLVDWFPWLQHFTPLTGSAAAGTRHVAMDLGHIRIAPSICYESVLAHVIRGQVASLVSKDREPDVLVNLTNDGWFWGSSELDMHLACGVFRAVECRKPFLIAANTGFSAWIDSNGRIVAQGPRRAEATLLAEVRPNSRQSWYLRYGDWPAGLCLVVCGGLAAAGVWDRWGRGRPILHKPSIRKG